MVAAVFSSRTALLASRAVGRVNSTTCLRSIPKAAFPTFSRYYADKASLFRHTLVNMPALSPTMTAGNIGGWQKQAGDKVSPGDEDGVLAKILLQTGEKDVNVGTPIAVMVDDAADVSAFENFTIDDAGGKASFQSDSKPSSSSESSKPPPPSEPTPPAAEESTSTGSRLQTSLERLEGLEFMASPAAKVLALEKGVPLKSVKGTGPNGRIVKTDVEKYTGTSSTASAAISGATGLTDTDIPLTGMRKSIATRLQSSMQTSPYFYIGSDISISKFLKLRVTLNASA
ncbi:uncharacterized protein DFL_009920 [Arthrobotrys flagrans]|uniref:Peripheral subunit-binding (PSBD) domain-containing protein n=1 Tax=Arthrobotrys flagrans TaxID=97331 RepID=A0A436ZT00_ARTFL|nr:hypothetical protein DFL_009920 [Arthrobotrys flagrans]